MTTYRHTQFGTVIVVSSGVGLLLLLVLVSGSAGNPFAIGVLLVLVAMALLFGSLTVTITEGILECRFGIGLIGKKFALRNIEEVESVRNRWFYGWGIRLTPHGWLFNVSELDAVEIRMSEGKRYRIGTDQPEELVRAIRQAASMDTYSAVPTKWAKMGE